MNKDRESNASELKSADIEVNPGESEFNRKATNGDEDYELDEDDDYDVIEDWAEDTKLESR